MLKDLVQKNRSIRRYDASYQVTKEQLIALVDLARLTPSAANRQPLKYILCCDPETNEKVFPCMGWAGYLQDWKGPEPQQRPTAYIVMITEVQIAPHVNIDPGIAAQTILLGAAEMGLNGCMIASVNKNKIRKALNIPTTYEILLAISIGKASEIVQIDALEKDGDIRYWRDDSSIHHVPKRKLEDVIVSF